MSSRVDAGIAALNSLEKERAGARWQVLSTWSADSSAKAAALSYFENTVPQAIAALSRRLDSRIADDAYWSRWSSDANDVHKGIAQVAGYSSEWSMLGVLLATGKATGGELGTAAQSAVKGAGVGAGLVAFLLLGYVALKVLK